MTTTTTTLTTTSTTATTSSTTTPTNNKNKSTFYIEMHLVSRLYLHMIVEQRTEKGLQFSRLYFYIFIGTDISTHNLTF